MIYFLSYSWVEDEIDYMYFRNNYPNEDNLKSKLLKERGSGMYVCRMEGWCHTRSVLSNIASTYAGFCTLILAVVNTV